jgi:hypothetical protein
MARLVKQYDLLISCPGDAIESVEIIKEVVEEFNQQFSDTLGIFVRCRYWKDSSYTESGGKPQDLLNKQIVYPSDLAVAVFKNRFGSPTDKYGSGTEEEIEEMLSAGKQVFMFFDESPVKLSDIDMDEYERVQAFKLRYKDKGIFGTFSNKEEFRTVFRAHITRHFMILSNEDSEVGGSNLVIRALSNGKIDEAIQLSLFDMGGFISSTELKSQIIERIKFINDYKLIKSVASEQPLMILGEKKVIIEEHTKDIIAGVADRLDLALSDDFFDVGNLTESPVFSMPLGGCEINGTSEEKTKYKAIISLEKVIYKAVGHMQMEQFYSSLYGIELIICNDGTKYDEDIDIEITIPKDRFLGVEELPVPTEEINTGDDWCFEDIFEIHATKDYIAYSDSKRPLTGMNTTTYRAVNPFSGRNYEEDYRDTLNDIFEYKVYPDGDYVIVKVHFDYIKQHQNVAFPTWLFIKNPDEGLKARYRIISKNNRNVIERQVDIKPCSRSI